MNTKHTQGKWRKSKTINDYSIYSENNHNNDIATVFQYSRSIPEDEAEANAKLIAAAPEMLEKLQSIINFHIKDNGQWVNDLTTDEIKEIQEAIKAATE
jgi:hypothetical protein